MGRKTNRVLVTTQEEIDLINEDNLEQNLEDTIIEDEILEELKYDKKLKKHKLKYFFY